MLLAEALVLSFDECGDCAHLREGLRSYREVLGLRPRGPCLRVEALDKLAKLLCRREC
jgi:hypothetical protein